MGIAAYNRGSKVIRDWIKSPEQNSLPDSVIHPAPDIIVRTAAPKPFAIGETVYCTVRALRGMPMEVTAVNRDRIKVTGSAAWCPAYNFQREPS